MYVFDALTPCCDQLASGPQFRTWPSNPAGADGTAVTAVCMSCHDVTQL